MAARPIITLRIDAERLAALDARAERDGADRTAVLTAALDLYLQAEDASRRLLRSRELTLAELRARIDAELGAPLPRRRVPARTR